jgi:hypothetical protein
VDGGQQAVDPSKDILFTKTHYSAFAAGQQLLQILRGRFVTEIYVCGALTNISIYATALDAASHGYTITLIDDCCGYRSDMRHSNAIHQLMHLTGCEVTTAEDAMAEWKPKKQKRDSNSRQRAVSANEDPTGGARLGREINQPSGIEKAQAGAHEETARRGHDLPGGLQSSLETLTLNGETTAHIGVPSDDSAQPHSQTIKLDAAHTRAAPIEVSPAKTGGKFQPLESPTIAVRPAASAARPNQMYVSQHVDNAPLEPDPDLLVEPPSLHEWRRDRRRIEAKVSTKSRTLMEEDRRVC